MSLSPEARALFDRARQAAAPSAAERARLFDRLEKLTAPPSAPPPPLPPASGAPLAIKTLMVVLVAAALLSPLYAPEIARAPEPAAAPAPPSRAAVSAPRSAPVVELDDAVIVLDEPADGPDDASPVEAPNAASSRPRRHGADLGGELTLLRQAQAARREGRFADALRTLERHARRFPRGILTTEREVARALVLCESGRRSQGLDLAARFDGTAYAPSLAHACAADEESAPREMVP